MNGENRRQLGMDRVSGCNAGFLAWARAEAAAIARSRGKVSACDLRERAKALGVEPSHPNAWGPVFRSPMFRRRGFARSRTVSAHSRLVTVWELAP